MRCTRLFSAGLITVIGISPFAIAQKATAIPAILLTEDVGSRVNVRAEPTTQAEILHQGSTGDRVNTLQEVPGDDGFVWYNVEFEDSVTSGWVREDLLQLDTHEPPIRTGRYWVGPIGVGIEVDGDQFQYYEAGWIDAWRPISELQFITDGVILFSDDYWCHADLPALALSPELRNSAINKCFETGWGWVVFDENGTSELF